VLLPAAKDIAASPTIVVERFVLIAVLVVLATMPTWIPLAATQVAPAPAERALAVIRDLITRHSRTLGVAIIATVGMVLVARGVLRIVTG
jgi:hypothetical protein